MQIKAPKGVADILPEDIFRWRYVEDTLRNMLQLAGFDDIRLPMFEQSALFSRSIGGETDIVAKEMYTFSDKGKRSFSLRPEGTASAVRAYLEHRLYIGKPETRLYYIGPMFRAERPQAGRYRQFHQLGAEVFGNDSAFLDAEVIALLMYAFEKLGLESLCLQLNTLGCKDCRPQYQKDLTAFLADHKTGLCSNCMRRSDTNPLRVFDCKNGKCQEVLAQAPSNIDSVCDKCSLHFNQVLNLLKGLNIIFEIKYNLVRGLDYYNKTAFEITARELGAQNAVAGGGRYDGLVEQLGGAPTPAFGFAVGIERLLLLLADKEIKKGEPEWIYLILLGDKALQQGFILQDELRKHGFAVRINSSNQTLKKQLKQANKLDAPLVGIMGEDELNRGCVILRDMRHGTQEELPVAELIDKLGTV